MRYKGAVNYYINLPSNPTQGDVWVVRYEGTTGVTPNGHAYCWDEAPVSDEPDAVLEFQWIDLGNLGEFLPSNTGKIYYNGVCYSGGGATGNFFSKTEIDTGKNNLRSLYNSTLTTQPNVDSINNFIFLDVSDVSILGDYASEILGNFIFARGSNLSFTSSLYSNFIFGHSHNINVSSLEYATIFGRWNRIQDGASQLDSNLYCPILIGESNTITGASDFSSTSAAYALIGSYNTAVITSGGWPASTFLYAIGNYNQLAGYENYIFGYQNESMGTLYSINIGIQNKLYGSYESYAFGYLNQVVSSNYTYIFGYGNTISNANNVYILGQTGSLSSSLYNSMRLGFYPLDNNDFFAIGDGDSGSNRSSIIRIDSNKNIYLNSTVPTPPIPTTDGDYKLHVEDGTATWVLLS